MRMKRKFGEESAWINVRVPKSREKNIEMQLKVLWKNNLGRILFLN